MARYFPQAPLKIDVLIVGGGLCGLACAYTLGRSGHRVRVLEKSDGSQRGAGVRLPPNLTKILVEWGLGDELRRCVPCRKSTFTSVESGDILGVLEWQEEVIKETGGQFLLGSYDDLYQMLHRLALSVGAVINYNAAVAAVASTPTPSVRLENGTTLRGDLIIGADGWKSKTREFVTEQKDTGSDGGYTYYTACIPVDRMVDPDLAILARVPQWPIGMGDNRFISGFPTGNHFSLTMVWPDTDVAGSGDAPEGWDVFCPTSILDLSQCDDRFRRLFNLMPTAHRAKYVFRDRVEDWVDRSGRILLVGEAAHPTIPTSTHGPSMAIEDAEALGVLMSHLSCLGQIPQLTGGFQELRERRCDFIHFGEMGKAELVMIPPGPAREIRDAELAQSLATGVEHWDEGMLQSQWETIEVGFAYHVREAAEDWWIMWGSLDDSARAASARALL